MADGKETGFYRRERISYNRNAHQLRVGVSNFGVNSDTQKAALFSQFQQQYSAVRLAFPADPNNPMFKPAPETDDYDRLEAYWLFCFAEWYATNRLSPAAYSTLWKEYYSPLIMNALDTPSLRYALETMLVRFPHNRGDYRAFFMEIADLARTSGNPLSDEAQKLLRSTP